MNTELQVLPSFITSIKDNLSTPTINSRELHKFLGNKRQYTDWIKQRIDQFGFIEGEDFIVHKFVNTDIKGFNEYRDYIVSPNMAKELGMLENNDKGKAIRKYFIDCEQNLIKLLQKENNMKQHLLDQPERVYLKRNTLTDLSYVLGLERIELSNLLKLNGYCDHNEFPLPRAKGEFDCVKDEIRWSLPLIMRLMR